jgi:hypothetical protein
VVRDEPVQLEEAADVGAHREGGRVTDAVFELEAWKRHVDTM